MAFFYTRKAIFLVDVTLRNEINDYFYTQKKSIKP